MKIMMYDTARYDEDSFEQERVKFPGVEIIYQEADLDLTTVVLAKGCDAVCAFVNSTLSALVLQKLKEYGIGLVLLRCAGFNHVDLAAAKECNITVLRVPGYSGGGSGTCDGTGSFGQSPHSQKLYQGTGE